MEFECILSQYAFATSIETPQLKHRYYPTEEERGDVPLHDRKKAAHEINHAYILYLRGASIRKITTIPKPGEYDAVTEFDGHISVDTFCLAASAGGRHTPYGHAEGHGSDDWRIMQFGKSPESVRQGAAAILDQHLPTPVHAKAAEIIAHEKTITGNDGFEKVILQAAEEAKMTNNTHEEVFAFTPHHVVGKTEDKQGNTLTTTLEYLPDNMIRLRNLRNNSVTEEHLICGDCNSVMNEGGHTMDCAKNQTGELHPDSSPVSKEDVRTRSGVIYDAKKHERQIIPQWQLIGNNSQKRSKRELLAY